MGRKVVAVKKVDGAPTKYTPTAIAKLKAAFSYSFTVDQACIYAGISKPTFYNWLESYPDFVDQMTKAREQPTMQARQVVVDAVKSGDAQSARWWLERKVPDEFGKQREGTVVNVNFNQVAKEERDEFNTIDAV